MIDDINASASTLRLLASQTLKSWKVEAVMNLLFDKDYIVRTLAARELQMRGEPCIFNKLTKMLSDERAYIREISVFILGQLRTPNMPYKNDSPNTAYV